MHKSTTKISFFFVFFYIYLVIFTVYTIIVAQSQ